MRRPPQEIVLLLADAIKSARQGDFISTAELHKKSSIHYRTLQSYFEMVNYIQSKLPQIAAERTAEGSGVRIISKPSLDISEVEEFVLWLFDKGAFREVSALPTPDWVSKRIIGEASSLKYTKPKDGKAYLSSEGILKAAELADKRDDAIIHPIGKQFTQAQAETEGRLLDEITTKSGFWACKARRVRSGVELPFAVCDRFEDSELGRGSRIVDYSVIRKEEAV